MNASLWHFNLRTSRMAGESKKELKTVYNDATHKNKKVIYGFLSFPGETQLFTHFKSRFSKIDWKHGSLAHIVKRMQRREVVMRIVEWWGVLIGSVIMCDVQLVPYNLNIKPFPRWTQDLNL